MEVSIPAARRFLLSLLILMAADGLQAQPASGPDWRSVVAPTALPSEPSVAQLTSWLRDPAIRLVSLEAADGTT